jgi:hypothetical protein
MKLERHSNFSWRERSLIIIVLLLNTNVSQGQWTAIPKTNSILPPSSLYQHDATSFLGIGFNTTSTTGPSALLQIRNTNLGFSSLRGELGTYSFNGFQEFGSVDICKSLVENNRFIGICQQGGADWINYLQNNTVIGYPSIPTTSIPYMLGVFGKLGVNGTIDMIEKLKFVHTTKKRFEITLDNLDPDDWFSFTYTNPLPGSGIIFPLSIKQSLGVFVQGLFTTDRFRLIDDNSYSDNMILVSDVEGTGHWKDPSFISDKYWEKLTDWNFKSKGDYKKVGLFVENELLSQFQINEGASKVSIGSVNDDDFHFGSGYLGFNAARVTIDEHGEKITPYWQFDVSDNEARQSGGGIIWSDLDGSLFFATMPSFDNPKSGSSKYEIQHHSYEDKIVREQARLIISPTGFVGINTDPQPDYRLAVNGKIIAEELDIKLREEWPDYVFNKNYILPDLHETENYIKTNNHLPGVPSSEQISQKGMNVGEINTILLKKVEELTLYIISLQKEVENLKQEKSTK